MKRLIHASEEITNAYLNELFKKIDWDDVDYADRLIDRTIKKELGVDRILDQAKYINMLDEGVKRDLMDLLSDPDAIHARRMKGKKKSASKASKSKAQSSNVELKVKFEDYPDGRIKNDSFEGTSLLEALKSMVSNLLLYIDVEQIESDNMSAEDVLQAIEERNGDGCDYIIELVANPGNKVLMDYPIDEYDD